jgi:hypothetical protein
MTTTRNDGPHFEVCDEYFGFECREAFGRNGPALALNAFTADDDVGVYIDLTTARELRDFLNAFLWRNDID